MYKVCVYVRVSSCWGGIKQKPRRTFFLVGKSGATHHLINATRGGEAISSASVSPQREWKGKRTGARCFFSPGFSFVVLLL